MNPRRIPLRFLENEVSANIQCWSTGRIPSSYWAVNFATLTFLPIWKLSHHLQSFQNSNNLASLCLLNSFLQLTVLHSSAAFNMLKNGPLCQISTYILSKSLILTPSPNGLISIWILLLLHKDTKSQDRYMTFHSLHSQKGTYEVPCLGLCICDGILIHYLKYCFIYNFTLPTS